jgi:hypothetical protein
MLFPFIGNNVKQKIKMMSYKTTKHQQEVYFEVNVKLRLASLIYEKDDG